MGSANRVSYRNQLNQSLSATRGSSAVTIGLDSDVCGCATKADCTSSGTGERLDMRYKVKAAIAASLETAKHEGQGETRTQSPGDDHLRQMAYTSVGRPPPGRPPSVAGAGQAAAGAPHRQLGWALRLWPLGRPAVAVRG